MEIKRSVKRAIEALVIGSSLLAAGCKVAPENQIKSGEYQGYSVKAMESPKKVCLEERSGAKKGHICAEWNGNNQNLYVTDVPQGDGMREYANFRSLEEAYQSAMKSHLPIADVCETVKNAGEARFTIENFDNGWVKGCDYVDRNGDLVEYGFRADGKNFKNIELGGFNITSLRNPDEDIKYPTNGSIFSGNQKIRKMGAFYQALDEDGNVVAEGHALNKIGNEIRVKIGATTKNVVVDYLK